MLERLVLRPRLLACANVNQLQSAYSESHCTNTALEVLYSVYVAAADNRLLQRSSTWRSDRHHS